MKLYGAVAASLLLALVRPAAAETLDLEKAARVKAAYVLNFARYTQWPDGAFEKADSPIVIAEIGSCDVGNALGEVVTRSEPIGGRRIELRRAPWFAGYDPPEDLVQLVARSHLVYICPTSAVQVEALLEQLRSTHVLTVGEMPGFAANGGMIGFVLKEDRIVFEANPKAIQNGGVTVSGKVLKLAQIVEEEIP